MSLTRTQLPWLNSSNSGVDCTCCCRRLPSCNKQPHAHAQHIRTYSTVCVQECRPRDARRPVRTHTANKHPQLSYCGFFLPRRQHASSGWHTNNHITLNCCSAMAAVRAARTAVEVCTSCLPLMPLLLPASSGYCLAKCRPSAAACVRWWWL